MRSHLRSGATPRLAHRDRTAEPAVCPCKRVFRTLITLTGTVARERVPCQRQRCARERPTPPVRRVPDSLPGRGLRDVPRDAPCGPRCAEIRPTCSKLAPRARNSRRGAEIRVAKTPSDDEPSHFFFFSLPLEIPSFFGTLIEILYIYYIFYFLTPPRYFGQRNTRLGYFLGHFRCSSVRQIRDVYIFSSRPSLSVRLAGGSKWG